LESELRLDLFLSLRVLEAKLRLVFPSSPK